MPEQTPSLLVQLLVLGLMVLILLLMMSSITSLIEERQERQHHAEVEIAETWGLGQRISGPMLSVAAIESRLRHDGEPRGAHLRRSAEPIQLLPEILEIDVEMLPQQRRRGIFKTLVYTAQVVLRGEFRLEGLDQGADHALLWPRAELRFGPSDLRGLLGTPRLSWNGEPTPIEPCAELDPLRVGTLCAAGLVLARPAQPEAGIETAPESSPSVLTGRLPFEIEMTLRGSGDFELLPLGRETRATLISRWPNPSFYGAFLPSAPATTEDGLRAEWSIPYFARGYGQRLDLDSEDLPRLRQALEGSAFGVRLLLPVDFYQQAIRCTKYALLFIVLIFGAFLLSELIHSVGLHPVQYLMVGSALALFYLLLLALAEHVGFHRAYLGASAVTVLLVSAYGASLLRSRARGAGVAATTSAMYGVIYVLVQLQTYSLLVGSLVLFAALAVTMFLTRNIDWHKALPVWRGSQRVPESEE